MSKTNSLLYRLLISLPMVCLLIAMLVIVHHQNQLVTNNQANQFTFKQSEILIKGVGSSDTIAYQDIESIEYKETIEFQGKAYNGEEYFNGDFTFKEIGDARAYIYPKVKGYIIIRTSKKTYVVNEYDQQATQNLYKKLKNR